VYHQPVNPVAAFVVAGGKSTRMGADKAFLELGGQTLLARALALSASVCGEVRIAGDRQRFFSFARVVEDIYPGRGPLAAIQAALVAGIAQLNLMLAVDLPFMEPRFLSYLLAESSRTGALVTVPRIGGKWQPLCAVYRPEFSALAEESLRKRKNRVDALFERTETRIIGDQEFTHAGFSPLIFRNLNTPEEWERAKLEFDSPGLQSRRSIRR